MEKKSTTAFRILMIAPQPFFEPRGTPLSVYDRLKALSELGYEIDLVTYHIGEPVEFPRVRIFRTLPIPFIKTIKIGPSFAKLFLDFLLIFHAFFLLLSNRYNVLHSHEEAAFFSMFLSWMFRIDHIYDMHSRLPQQLRNSKFKNWKPVVLLFDFLEKKVLTTCSAVITIADDLEEYAREINPALLNIKVENLPLYASFQSNNSAEIKGLRDGLNLEDKQVIVYTGNFEPYQGIDLLIESFKVVFEAEPRAFLILVGGTEDQIVKLGRKIRKLQMSERVYFTGSIYPSDVMKFIDIATLLVSPRLEGLSIPLKIYTYIHSGKPILATDIPAHRLVSNHGINLTNPTVECFSRGILELLGASVNGNHRTSQIQSQEKLRHYLAEYNLKIKTLYQIFEKPAVALETAASVVEE
jgi:glycosyltransferase involved in cell wall biosynthesis